MEQPGQFDLGLEEYIVETSPDFDDLSTEPPKNKQRRKVATKKVQECLVKDIGALRLSELTAFCLDKTWYKVTGHTNPLVKEFSLAFESNDIFFNDIFFIVRCLKNLFTEVYLACAQKKDKFINFQFQWHQKCGLLLVKSTAELAQLRLDPADVTTNAVLTARQQWVNFYEAKMVGHEVAKIFMLIFLAEVYDKLLKVNQLALQVPPDTTATQCTSVHVDSIDVYYRFGGATLASMLHGRYKAMKLKETKQKGKISQEIHVLQALNTKNKENVPKYLQYRDKGFMYFPCDKLLPFLQELDKTVKTCCNEEGFRKYGKLLLQETVKLVKSKTNLKESFSAVLTSCLESTRNFQSSVIDDVFHEFVSKLTNTRIQEFLDLYKATSAIKKGMASVSGQRRFINPSCKLEKQKELIYCN